MTTEELWAALAQELWAALAQALRTVRARDDFIAVVAHELRNPMTPMIAQVQRLLSKARRLDAPTASIDETRGGVGQFYGDNRLSLAPGTKSLAAHANHCQLDDVGISYAHFGRAIELAFPMFTAGFSMPFAVAGRGTARTRGQVVDLDPHQTVIVSPGAPLHVKYGSGFETITVQLSAAAMQRKLASVIGDMPRADIVFEPLLDFRRAQNGLWRRLVWWRAPQVLSHRFRQWRGAPLEG